MKGRGSKAGCGILALISRACNNVRFLRACRGESECCADSAECTIYIPIETAAYDDGMRLVLCCAGKNFNEQNF